MFGNDKLVCAVHVGARSGGRVAGDNCDGKMVCWVVVGIESRCWLSTRKSMWIHWQAGRQVISDTGRRQAGTETSTQKNKQLQTNSSEQGDGMQTDWRTVKKRRSTGAMQTSGLKGSFVGVTHSSYWLWEGEGREDMWEKETLLWPPGVPAMIPRQKKKDLYYLKQTCSWMQLLFYFKYCFCSLADWKDIC